MTAPIDTADSTVARDECDPATRVTKSLLGYGIISGPLYIVVSLAQAVSRDGFDLARHQWSLLANGAHGWIQVVNFVVTGVMTIAGAVGLARALRPGRVATWGPRLIGVFGAGVVAAGIFRPDPALGFPVGTPDGPPAMVTLHGTLHFVAAGVAFGCLAAACFVLARRFSAEGRRGWTVSSRLVGGVFLAGFAAIASTAGSVAANIVFIVAVVAVYVWTSAIAADRNRRLGHTASVPAS
ncbi:MAG TPA: DUF998 domain-containing protein [Jiangellaceae bacterium]